MRSLSLTTHSLLELLAGVALLAAPFALGFDAAGTVAAVSGGVLLVGLALADSLPLRSHQAFDLVLMTVLGALGGVLAVAGDGIAAVVLIGVAGLLLALTSVTRWSRPY
jgi:hypothetical protein